MWPYNRHGFVSQHGSGNSKLFVFLVSGYTRMLWATGGAPGAQLHCQGEVQPVKTEDSGNVTFNQ